MKNGLPESPEEFGVFLNSYGKDLLGLVAGLIDRCHSSEDLFVFSDKHLDVMDEAMELPVNLAHSLGFYQEKSKHLEGQLAESQNQTMRAVELAEDFNNKSQLVLQAMKDLTQAYVELKNRGCRHETFSTKTLDKDIYV